MNKLRQTFGVAQRGRRPARRCGEWLLAACAIAAAGCSDFGTGGTGEWVVPKPVLREVSATDLAARSQGGATSLPTTGTTTKPTTREAREVRLSIEEARQMALRNNLDLKVELFNPTIARERVSEEEAAFESLFTVNASYAKLDQPTASALSGSQLTDTQVRPGVEVPLRTGGSVKLDVPLDKNQTNNQFATLNPAYSSDATATLTQPLLRGFGPAVNSHRIRVAFYSAQAAEARAKLEVIRVLADVDRIYWRLYAARQELLVRKQEYDLAGAQLERARRQVRAGTVADVDVVRAESGLADTIESIITAENTVRDRERELKRIMAEPTLGLGQETVVIPDTTPAPVLYRLDPEKLSREAMSKRMELLETELRIAQEASNIAFARNGMLPLVSLEYQYNINGLGGNWGQSFTQLREKDYEDHTLGLRLEIPIGNEAARSRYRQALAARMQQLATKEQRILQIRKEVFDAVDQLDANWQRIVAARQRVVLAARVLDVETRQFTQGLRTSTDVLDAQTRLATARLSEINAVTEYQIAQVDIAFATGTVLGASGVAWEPARVK